MLVVRKTKHYMTFLSLVIVFVVILSTEARAETFGFYHVTNNDTADVAAGEAQLTVDVTDPGSDQVKFTFHNEGSYNMFISKIYFYDGKLEYNSFLNGPGTNYVVDVGPYPPGEGLAGYKNQTPLSLFLLTEAASPGTGGDGIDPGDWLSVTFKIKDHINDDFAEILGDMHSMDMVVGIKVQGMGFGEDTAGSESFITPLPGAVLLGILGMGVAGLKLRKFA